MPSRRRQLRADLYQRLEQMSGALARLQRAKQQLAAEGDVPEIPLLEKEAVRLDKKMDQALQKPPVHPALRRRKR